MCEGVGAEYFPPCIDDFPPCIDDVNNLKYTEMSKYNPDIHLRRSVRLKGYDYSREGLYFITICVQNRECIFGNIVNGEMIQSNDGERANNCWLEIPQHYQNIVLREFVIMPNHIHGILEIVARVGGEKRVVGVENIRPLRRRRPNCESGTIGAIVRGFKIGVTKQIGYSIWQRGYHEHIIRDRNRHVIIVDYINNNPARWESGGFYYDGKSDRQGRRLERSAAKSQRSGRSYLDFALEDSTILAGCRIASGPEKVAPTERAGGDIRK